MLFNSSSPSNSSLEYLLYHCSNTPGSALIITVFNITRAVLLLPISILVLYLGHQQWRQQQCSFAKMSHSDIFIYHMLVMELIWFLGCLCYLCGSYVHELVLVGYCASTIAFYGEVVFHLLTCVERYLAVVHPITYMGLRNARGVRIRNISIGCVWLMCIGWVFLTVWHMPSFDLIPLLCLIIFSLVVVSFCSLSVLCVLIHPGPREVCRDKDQLKRRAFFTITAITVALWLWFAGYLVSVVVYMSPLLSHSISCLVLMSAGWFNLPCSLVLPLLYLHRAGKLSCCRYK